MSTGRPSWMPRSCTASWSEATAERDPMAPWCLTGRMLGKHERHEAARDGPLDLAVAIDVEDLLTRRPDRDDQPSARCQLLEQRGRRSGRGGM